MALPSVSERRAGNRCDELPVMFDHDEGIGGLVGDFAIHAKAQQVAVAFLPHDGGDFRVLRVDAVELIIGIMNRTLAEQAQQNVGFAPLAFIARPRLLAHPRPP